ncbi:hypothetical protein K439DRAFT_249830 [Ramaria rubella]|nr:hypothetical protein K439DRAFT_249830 [Ramaria rubella]
MFTLKAWYQTIKSHYGGKAPRLVVMIKDLHVIGPPDLRDFLELCSYHVPDVPLIFLLGSSDSYHLHSVLPRSTLACLRLERRTLLGDINTLEYVMKELFFSLKFTPNVMIGPAGFEMLFKEFKRHNSMLDALLSTLQLLHMQHFYNPLAFIGDSDYDMTLHQAANITSEAWKHFFQLLRRQYISRLITAGLPPDEPEARSAFNNRMIRLRAALRLLEIIVRFARAHGLQVTDVLVSFESMGLKALQGTLGKHDSRNICSIMRQLKPTEAQALLEELYHFVHNLPTVARTMENALKTALVFARNDPNVEKSAQFWDFLAAHFEKTFTAFDDIVCLDVWWTGDTIIPNSPLNPNPHLNIVTSLLEPQDYLGLPSSTERVRELATFPDACIVFRRYAESGKLINVYDWYESFSLALEDYKENEMNETMDNQTPTKRKEKRQKKTLIEGKNLKSSELQARFLRSMHELEFVGFLGRTGRKADHVVKTLLDLVN